MLPVYVRPYGWHHADDPDAPWWFRGHTVWEREYGRRFWPVVGRLVKRSKARR